jgi:hypothetical protein
MTLDALDISILTMTSIIWFIAVQLTIRNAHKYKYNLLPKPS